MTKLEAFADDKLNDAKNDVLDLFLLEYNFAC